MKFNLTSDQVQVFAPDYMLDIIEYMVKRKGSFFITGSNQGDISSLKALFRTFASDDVVLFKLYPNWDAKTASKDDLTEMRSRIDYGFVDFEIRESNDALMLVSVLDESLGLHVSIEHDELETIPELVVSHIVGKSRTDKGVQSTMTLLKLSHENMLEHMIKTRVPFGIELSAVTLGDERIPYISKFVYYGSNQTVSLFEQMYDESEGFMHSSIYEAPDGVKELFPNFEDDIYALLTKVYDIDCEVDHDA